MLTFVRILICGLLIACWVPPSHSQVVTSATCGQQLSPDASFRGVPARSNAPYQGKYKDCDTTAGPYGELYQCVEYVRRFYAQRDDVSQRVDTSLWKGNAIDFYNTPPNGMKWFTNGEGVGPEAGDILVFSGGSYGHVAIVTDKTTSSNVSLIEQNWDPSGLKSLPMIANSNGTFTVSDRTSVNPQDIVTLYHVMGWLRPSPGSFNFAVDSLRVTGNVNGGAGFFDDFSGGPVASPPILSCIAPNSVIDSGGFLLLTNANGANTLTPGFQVDNCQLGAEAPAFRLNQGAGNSVITASFRADATLPGQGYGLQLFTNGTDELVNIQVTGSGGEFVSAVTDPNFSNVAAVPVKLAGVQRLILRLAYDDTSRRVTPSFSIDGGTRFTEIVLPQPAMAMTRGSQAIVSIFGVTKVN